jgi:hypothetical protein
MVAAVSGRMPEAGEKRPDCRLLFSIFSKFSATRWKPAQHESEIYTLITIS